MSQNYCENRDTSYCEGLVRMNQRAVDVNDAILWSGIYCDAFHLGDPARTLSSSNPSSWRTVALVPYSKAYRRQQDLSQ